jgi:hypothetical protein
MAMNEFNGHKETVHQSFGIPANVYGLMAQAALHAEELAGIEPQTLERFHDGRPGALLFMWGQKYSYFIALECSSSPATLQLSACPLDGHFHRPLLSGDATSHALWHCAVSRMIEVEGILAAPFESVQEWWDQTQPQIERQAQETSERLLRAQEKSAEARRK